MNTMLPVERRMSRGFPDRLLPDLDRLFFPWAMPARSLREPAVMERPIRLKIADKEDQYEVEAELPGARKEDLEVKVERDLVTISVRRELKPEAAPEKEAGGRVLYSDRFIASTFASRSFTLPEELAVDGHRAKLEEGVLKLNLLKREPGKAQSIQVAVE